MGWFEYFRVFLFCVNPVVCDIQYLMEYSRPPNSGTNNDAMFKVTLSLFPFSPIRVFDVKLVCVYYNDWIVNNEQFV